MTGVAFEMKRMIIWGLVAGTMSVSVAVMVTSCQEDITMETIVLPEDVLFVSGEKVRLAGRLIAGNKLNVEDHGFEIALDNVFSSPLTISLGARSTPGRFLGEMSGLINDTLYYWRPFVIISGSTILGETREFSTLAPFVTSYSPLVGFSGQFMFIEGRNLSEDLEVFFGNAQAQVKEVISGARIQVVIPPIGDAQFVDVNVRLQNDLLTFENQFEYVIGKWEKYGEFITNLRYTATMNFQTDTKFVFGLGTANFQENSLIWELDLNTWTWSEIPFAGPGIKFPFSSNGFFGTGQLPIAIFPLALTNGLWSYNEMSNQFEVKKALPFALYKSIALTINGKLFVFGGELPNRVANTDYYEYNEAEDSWTLRGRSTLVLTSDFPHFSFGEYAYFLNESGELHRYGTENRIWELINIFPSTVEPDGIAEVIGDKAYIGVFASNRSLWEYDIASNEWKSKIGFGGAFFLQSVASWVHDDVLYVMKNPKELSDEPMSIWSFKPNEF